MPNRVTILEQMCPENGVCEGVGEEMIDHRRNVMAH